MVGFAMPDLICCEHDCGEPADFQIDNPRERYMELHSCAAHLSDLVGFDAGQSEIVTPLPV